MQAPDAALLPVFGADGWQVTELDHGILTVDKTRRAPLGALLDGWSGEDHKTVRWHLNLTNPQRRRYFALPCTGAAVGAVLGRLARGDRQYEITLLQLLGFWAAEEVGADVGKQQRWLHDLHVRAGGTDLGDDERVRRLDGSSLYRMTLRLAEECYEGVDPVEALHTLLCHWTGPFRLRAEVDETFEQATFDAGGGLRLPGPADPRTGLGTLDVVWPNLSRRLILVGDGRRWCALELTNPGWWRDDAGRSALWHFTPKLQDPVQLDGRDQALAWIGRRLADHPPDRDQAVAVSPESDYDGELTLAGERNLRDPMFYTANGGYCDVVIRRFAPAHQRRELADRSGVGQVSFTLDYERLARLRDRARQLQVPGRTNMGADELRFAIADHAVAAVPYGQLLDVPCAFVRHPAGWETRQAPVDGRREALEALTCRRPAGGWVRADEPAYPHRLRPRVDSLEAYLPLNPFAGAARDAPARPARGAVG